MHSRQTAYAEPRNNEITAAWVDGNPFCPTYILADRANNGASRRVQLHHVIRLIAGQIEMVSVLAESKAHRASRNG